MKVDSRYKYIWCATTKDGIFAVWYKGCFQPFNKWRKAVKSIAYNKEDFRIERYKLILNKRFNT